MPEKKLGNKCLVDTARIYNENGESIDVLLPQIAVEMDGFMWESTDYETLEEFFQAIIDHAYDVAMGKE